jgi:hypothetical protein
MDALDELIAITGHARYRELYEADPETWGPMIRRQLSAIKRVRKGLGPSWMACPHLIPLPPEERGGCGCLSRCNAGRSHREDGKVDPMRCDQCVEEHGPPCPA